MGQGACSLYWTEVQSPLWVQLLFRIADYKTFLSYLSQDTTPTVQIPLFFPRPLTFGLVSETISKCVGSVHAWCWPEVTRSMLSWSQSYSLLGLALGSVQGYYSKKNMKNNYQHSFLIYVVFQMLFLWNFSRLWKYIIRNSLYRVQCFRREIILLDLKFICKIYPTEKWKNSIEICLRCPKNAE